ncbi:transposase [Candidatus Jidaibacter acanthamoebae]
MCIIIADSTSIKACHIKREKRHRVFAGYAAKGRNSMGWFFRAKVTILLI